MALDYRKRKQLAKDFASAINRVSAENDSNTPDFILAEYLVRCLETFAIASIHREDWYGKRLEIGDPTEQQSESRG